MVVDSSAVIAIIAGEPGAESLVAALASADDARMSTSYLVAGIGLDRMSDPVVGIARAAYRDFGKGSGHPAQPNYADCFSSALAIDRGEPLLFMGEDFGHTDVGVASW